MDTWSPAVVNDHVERARKLAPHIEACADQIEHDRRLVEPVLNALFAAGMFRLLIRLASTFAIHQVKAVSDMTHHAGGATSIFIENAFDRGFRDMHAVTQQLQGRQPHFETVGRFLLGLELDTTFL